MKAQIVRLVQGSPEWLDHRRAHRNASETAAVLGLSPYTTPYQLWLLRTGRAKQEVTAPMRHGTAMEPQAREAYEAHTGNVMQPLVLVDGEYSASLDGMTFDGRLILEAKCPYQGRESKLWQEASAGRLVEHYQWQVQHQLMVSGSELAHVWVFDGQEGILLEVRPEPHRWPLIQSGWNEFMKLVREDRPPTLTEGDKRVRDDAGWQQAAEEYVRLKRAAEAAEKAAEAAKGQLIELASHSSETGCGVTVTRFWKAGIVDYKRVPALAGVDLDQFRSGAKQEVRVSLSKSLET